MKSILTSIAFSGLLAAVAVAQPSSYNITDLGPVGGTPGQPFFLNNHGLVSGAAAAPGGAMHAVLWYNGKKFASARPVSEVRIASRLA